MSLNRRFGFLLFATRWGSHSGGINTFNVDLCKALVAHGQRIGCVVLQASTADFHDAHPVELFSLETSHEFPTSIMAAAVGELLTTKMFLPEWCIGHDTISGELAIEVADRINSHVAIFHHMAPEIYKHLEGYSPEKIVQKRRQQMDVLNSAHIVFTVGPSLLRTAHDLIQDERIPIIEVVPGLSVGAHSPIRGNFRVLISGRLEDHSALNKQLDLSVAGFGAAASHPNGPLGQHPQLWIFGGKANESEEKRLMELAAKHAGRRVEVLPLAYELDRVAYLRTVAEQSAVMMLSWYEAFGLVAWEAIGLGVPLVISDGTGVAELLRRELPQQANQLTEFVNVRSGATPQEQVADDVRDVAAALTRIATLGPQARERAKILQEHLVAKGFTWARMSEVVINECKKAVPLPNMQQALVIADCGYDAIGLPAVLLALIADDPVDLNRDMEDLKEHVSGLPSLTRDQAYKIAAHGFDPNETHNELRAKILEFISTARVRAYATVVRLKPSMPDQRQALLTGLLKTRFSKRDQIISSVITNKKHRVEIAKAVQSGWRLSDRTGLVPGVTSETPGNINLLRLAQMIACAIRNAAIGEDSELRTIRRKVVHIWDADTRRNYGLESKFP